MIGGLFIRFYLLTLSLYLILISQLQLSPVKYFVQLLNLNR